MWMKNRFMQHSEELKVIQIPFYGACGVFGLISAQFLCLDLSFPFEGWHESHCTRCKHDGKLLTSRTWKAMENNRFPHVFCKKKGSQF
jgi:hypothetical protein